MAHIKPVSSMDHAKERRKKMVHREEGIQRVILHMFGATLGARGGMEARSVGPTPSMLCTRRLGEKQIIRIHMVPTKKGKWMRFSLRILSQTSSDAQFMS